MTTRVYACASLLSRCESGALILDKKQWLTLLDHIRGGRAFIAANEARRRKINIHIELMPSSNVNQVDNKFLRMRTRHTAMRVFRFGNIDSQNQCCSSARTLRARQTRADSSAACGISVG